MDIEEWPESATHKIEGIYTKWIGKDEYSWMNKEWKFQFSSFGLSYYVDSDGFEIIERPIDAPYVPKVGEWFTAVNGDDYMMIDKSSYDQFVAENKETSLRFFSSLGGAKTEREEFIEKAAKVLQKDDQDVTGLCNKSVEMFHSAAKALLIAGFTNKP